jgi:hypothetical protein
MPSLSDLSAELKLAIIESLEALQSDKNNFAPGTPLCRTPSRDMINLSCCCKTLRNLVAPKLYPSVRLQNSDKSGKSLLAVANSPWADLVHELHFEGFMTIAEDRLTALTNKSFPASVNEVLSHLERFPKLDVLTVRFVFGETPWEDAAAISNYFFARHGSEPFQNGDHLEMMEGSSPLRALMARTYNAIAYNSQSSITTLELLEVLPAGVSSWTTDSWAEFLGTVKTFKLSLRAYTDGVASWCNTTHWYRSFVENLGLLFFEHLNSVRSFCLTADECAAPGLTGRNHAALPFNSDHMPLLQSFELKCCFISERLARFISSHGKALEQIRLTDCFSAAGDARATEHTTWAMFLDMLSNGIESIEDSALEQLSISPATLGEKYCAVSQGVEIEGSDDEVEVVRRTMEDDPRRRMFSYATIERIDGDWYADGSQSLAAFLAGQDQAAFDKVMAAINHRR